MNPYPTLPWLSTQRAALRALPPRGVHAVLLYGARGIGKKSLALDVARDLLCESPQDGMACGACAGCELYRADNHPDVRVVVPDALSAWRLAGGQQDEEGAFAAPEPSTEDSDDKRESREIRIEQVRELADFFSVATHRGRWRVVVLAPADALGGAAANAALKTLEEPPPGTFFILCTDALDEVLPTVRSRCMLYHVPAPDRALASAWLSAQGVDDPAALLAASGGAPLEALLEAQDEAARAVLPGLLDALLGAGQSAMGALGGLKWPKAFAAVSAIRLFQRWGWDLLAHRNGIALRYHPALGQRIAALAARVSSDHALHVWQQQLAQLRRECAHPALNARTLIEQALMHYAYVFKVTG